MDKKFEIVMLTNELAKKALAIQEIYLSCPDNCIPLCCDLIRNKKELDLAYFSINGFVTNTQRLAK